MNDPPNPMPGFEHRRFAIENGDGEPALLHPRRELRRMTAAWFPDSLGEWGPAWLMEVTIGTDVGLLLGLTPRGGAAIEDQLLTFHGGWAKVVVHRLDISGPGPAKSVSAAGMAGLEELAAPKA